MSQHKNIVICCDGTGNEYGENKTNVVRTSEIAIHDRSQIVYYDPGVGTGGFEYEESSRQVIKDQATGRGLQKNVEDAYRFLMKNYEEGDKIFLFGFSRGAFTVRSLAGMLANCGLLRPHLENLVEYASKVYNKNETKLHDGFKENYSRNCPVHFIGVWDTVESLNFSASERFHDHRLNPEIPYAYHAVALDEIRKDFPPCLWDERRVDSSKQTLEQVWFAGVHSDVGGWYKEHGLSDIALRWMLANAKKCGMQLNEEKFANVKGDPLGEQHDSHEGIFAIRGKYKRKVLSEKISPPAKVHKSVQERMEKTGYEPIKPLPNENKIKWVDTPE